jgi:hypothetical protein
MIRVSKERVCVSISGRGNVSAMRGEQRERENEREPYLFSRTTVEDDVDSNAIPIKEAMTKHHHARMHALTQSSDAAFAVPLHSESLASAGEGRGATRAQK